MKKEILYIWLQLALGICNRLARELMIKFNDITEIYNCGDFSFLGEKRERYITRLENKDTSSAFEVMKRCHAIGAEITGYYDELFPDRLRLIDAPPIVLYSIGNRRNLNGVPCIAIVGTRKMTDYGKTTAEKFAYTFSKSGAVVVSGLAKGVDTAAHRGAVMAGGFTVAVLGNPIGEVYPRENEKAFMTLYKQGLVISEMYPKCPRTKADFPNRNRIISGLCDATVIAEAGDGSGALITARYALAQGRAVYAVPGDIGAENAGTNELIKKGIPIATEPYDVIAPLALEYPDKIRPYEPSLTANLRSYGHIRSNTASGGAKNQTERPKTPIAQNVGGNTAPNEREIISPESAVHTLSGGIGAGIKTILKSSDKPMTADELARALGLDAGTVLSELTLMEIDGSVISSAGARFLLNN